MESRANRKLTENRSFLLSEQICSHCTAFLTKPRHTHTWHKGWPRQYGVHMMTISFCDLMKRIWWEVEYYLVRSPERRYDSFSWTLTAEVWLESLWDETEFLVLLISSVISSLQTLDQQGKKPSSIEPPMPAIATTTFQKPSPFTVKAADWTASSFTIKAPVLQRGTRRRDTEEWRKLLTESHSYWVHKQHTMQFCQLIQVTGARKKSRFLLHEPVSQKVQFAESIITDSTDWTLNFSSRW